MNYEIANQLYSYNPLTGIVRYKHNDKPIGNKITKSGRRVVYKDKIYTLHRVAYLLVNGEWPQQFLVHKDGDKGNNKWNNLQEQGTGEILVPREATRELPKGVYRRKNKYEASYNKKYLGLYATVQEASEAYEAHVQELFDK